MTDRADLELDVVPAPGPAEAAALRRAVREALEERGVLASPTATRPGWRAAAVADAVEGLPARP